MGGDGGRVHDGHVGAARMGHAGARHDEDAVGVMGAKRHGARHHGGLPISDRDEAMVRKDQRQVGRALHALAREGVLPLQDLGDDALASLVVPHVKKVGDQPVAEGLVLLRGHACRAGLGPLADDDAVRGGRRAEGAGRGPVEVGEVRHVAAPRGLGPVALAPGQMAQLLEVEVHPHDLLGAGEAVVRDDDEMRVGRGLVQCAEIAVHVAEVLQHELAHGPRGLCRAPGPERGIEHVPGLVLDLVGPVHHQREEVGLVLLQETQADVEPLLVARQVLVHPGEQLLVGHHVADRALALEVPGQLLRVEVLEGLDPIE